MTLTKREIWSTAAGEGSVFSEIVRQVRQTREKLAKQALEEGYTVEDITYMVGFSGRITRNRIPLSTGGAIFLLKAG
ncbi:MAG: hypothetical protein ACLFST_12615 [Spirochaetia bacterium]